MAVSPTILRELTQFLSEHAPYSQLRPQDLLYVAEHAVIDYAPPGAEILRPDGKVPETLFIVRSGLVRWERPGAKDDDPVASTLSAGDSFPVGALYAERPIESLYRAADDVFLLRLPRAVFQELLKRSPAYVEHCKRRLTTLLDLSRRQQRAMVDANNLDAQGLGQQLEQLIRRPPLACRSGEPLRGALEKMSAQRVASILVTDDDDRPIGIVTLRDLIPRVILPQLSLDRPVGEVMTQPVATLTHDATAAEAAVTMVEQNIHHVPVTKAGKVLGVVSERDLFALQRRSLKDLMSMVAQARHIEDLQVVASDIRAYSTALVAQGVDARSVTGLISRLTDKLTQRALELIGADLNLPSKGWAWLSFGSEGRQEQTLWTDQDNGLLILDSSINPQTLAEFASRANDALARCGYELCKGGIMASNRTHRLDLASWEDRFEHWLDAGDPESVMEAGIYFDLRAVAGDVDAARAMHERSVLRAMSNRRFLLQMAQHALTFKPPPSLGGGLIEGWLNRGDNSLIDLKLQGTMLFVESIRVLALAQGITETSTRGRVRALVAAQAVKPREAEAWLDGFEFIQMQRLRAQLGEAHGRTPNQLDPGGLSVLDRKILVEACRQARRLQQRVALDFQG